MTTPATFPQISLSHHARVRLQQRGISHKSVRTVLQHGLAIHKQHLIFFHLPKARIGWMGLKDRDGLSKLVVITDLRKKEVVTCYKSGKAVRRIKKKPKRLRKHNCENRFLSY